MAELHWSNPPPCFHVVVNAQPLCPYETYAQASSRAVLNLALIFEHVCSDGDDLSKPRRKAASRQPSRLGQGVVKPSGRKPGRPPTVPRHALPAICNCVHARACAACVCVRVCARARARARACACVSGARVLRPRRVQTAKPTFADSAARHTAG